MTRRQRARLARWAVYAASLGVVVWVALLVDWARLRNALFRWEIVTEQFPEIVTQAARNTLIFTFFGFTGGVVIGLVVALMRLSSVAPYRWFATVYIELLRGLPLLLTIILIGFGLPIAMGVRVPFTYGPGSLALAMVAGAYIAETVRAGIEAVPRGQVEASRSLGMSHFTSMRSIVLPQAFRIIIPPLTNELILLLKDTSLISVLGVTEATKELTRFGRDGVNHYANATPLVVAGVMYLVITIPLGRLVALLERRNRASR
jgi:polar amino acid transport system permease protein